MAPFKVAEVVVTSLEALISAAALHLGDALPDGRALPTADQDADEAWFALLAAGALVDQLGPMMDPKIRQGWQDRLGELAERLAEAYPQKEFPAPAPVVASLQGLVEAAWREGGKP
jgi:hypothetical protein